MIKFADEFQPGESLEPIAVVVTFDWNEQILFAQQDYDPCYIRATGNGPPHVHPALLLAISANTRSPSYRLRPGTASVLAEDAVRFLAPATVDDRLAVTWRVVGVHEKRGRLHQTIDARITDSAGMPVLTRELRVVFPKRA
ncbi:MAG: hypothetical protein EXQ86_09080 [Rhodospirillales bacterium]|nr:hypothetical protein [Rhodospirillales bacterium]